MTEYNPMVHPHLGFKNNNKSLNSYILTQTWYFHKIYWFLNQIILYQSSQLEKMIIILSLPTQYLVEVFIRAEMFEIQKTKLKTNNPKNPENLFQRRMNKQVIGNQEKSHLNK